MNWNDLLLRLRALVFRNRVERELEDELDCHIEMQARKNVAAGMSEAEALRRGRRPALVHMAGVSGIPQGESGIFRRSRSPVGFHSRGWPQHTGSLGQ